VSNHLLFKRVILYLFNCVLITFFVLTSELYIAQGIHVMAEGRAVGRTSVHVGYKNCGTFSKCDT